jgi:DNA modification methylase
MIANCGMDRILTNPTTDLAAFIARHAKAYDPASDDYRRAPFAQPVKAGKNTAIYNAHSYHTKVPPQGIVPYLEHYTDPGDLVLDSFCGSGMTGVAALLSGRCAILNDLSPAAVHIARNYCTPVDVAALRREFARIQAAVQEEFDWLYGTMCDRCGGPATIQYTVWSDVFACGRCGEDLVLWEVAVDRANGKVLDEFACPTCAATWRKTQLRWLRSVPVLTNYECPRCRPKRAEHETTAAEKRRIAEIEATDIPYWYPTTPFREADWEMWRGVHSEQNISDISRFYTQRNMWAIARLRHDFCLIEDKRITDALMFVLTSALVRSSRNTRFMMGKSGNAPVSGTLYVPSLGTENNILALYTRKFNDCLDGFETIKGFSRCSIVLNQSASNLPTELSECVDYIFTDPPFGSNIFYADCNLLWEAWLDEGFTDQSHEAVVHVKHKNKNTLPDYQRLMTAAFGEMHRVLKPGRWASVVFHNSDDRIWQTILAAAEAAGFELAEINAFDKEQLSFKGIRGQKGLERVTNKDLVLNLRKPRAGERAAANGGAHSGEAEQRIVAAIADFLDGNPPPAERTLQGLWNRALTHMLRDGSVQVSMAQVGDLLPHYFKQVDGRWYLRGEAVAGGNVFNLKNDLDAITWLRAKLVEKPQTTGELIPLWQQETAHLGGGDAGRLDRLLRENFWPDPRSGHWREPTPDEREKMSARQSLASEAHLRTIRRFLDGGLDRRPYDGELGDWVRFCYQQQAYAEAVQLFPYIRPERVDAKTYGELKKIVAVCRLRMGG